MQKEQQQRSPYEILGVGRFTTQKEIRKRYLQLCKTHHPDVSANSSVDFREITVAYEMLANNKHQQALDIKHHSNHRSPIDTKLWTKRSYLFGVALVAFTFMYAYEGKSSPRVLLPHEKRKLAAAAAAAGAAQQQLPTTKEQNQVKRNDVTPWQAAGISFREWRKG
ncbi:DnaJ domain-containing protein [Parasitella parasitica]|nr:DnaJ domain-containing protein [Parasitella parasitica]